jgi:hypothetical protein
MVTESTLRQASTSRPSHATGCVARRAFGAILFSAVFALAISTGRAAQAEDPPLGIFIYTISRDGAPIGQQRLEFVGDGEKLRVISRTELDVTLLGLSLYGLKHQMEEVHAGGKMLSLTSEADEDGKDRKVNLSLQGDLLKGTYNGDVQRAIDPALSTTLWWQKPATGQTQVIDALRGKVRDITVTDVGPETLNLPVGRVEARHYRVTGELTRDLWYDAAGVLVAGLLVKDGASVRQELQQRP